jgi:hypothetical protein
MENVIKKSLNKQNKKLLILTTIFLVLGALFIFLGIKEQKKDIGEPISFDTLYESEDRTNKYAYINLITEPYLFAVYEQDGQEYDSKYYLGMDEDSYLYIIRMSSKNYEKLTSASETNVIKISGITKKIQSDIKDLAIEAYNKGADTKITLSNFEDYFGTVFLDINDDPRNMAVFYILGGLFLILFISFGIARLIIKSRNKKLIKKFTDEEIYKLNNEILAINSEEKLYFLTDHLVDLGNGCIIVKYEDILWAYTHEMRTRGILVGKTIMLCLKNKIEEFYEKLVSKKEDVLIGFTNENQKAYKELVKKG